MQLFLIWAGALVVPVLGLMETGGWGGLKTRVLANTANVGYLHVWSTLGDFRANSMGVHWTGIVFGLGFVGALGLLDDGLFGRAAHPCDERPA